MLELLDSIPFFVWPVFCVLLIGGLKARKPHIMPLPVVLILPTLFLSWNVYSLFVNYGTNIVALLLWAICFVVGMGLGYLNIQRMNFTIDRPSKKIHLPGSWIPLSLSMSIFSAKFSLGMLNEILPHYRGSVSFLLIDLSIRIKLSYKFGVRRLGAAFLVGASARTN